jgi:hypothetical protein
MENEKRVLRWGGLAGILAVIAFIVDMPIYAFADPASAPLGGPEGLMRFTDIRVALVANTILMMMVAIFSIALILALFTILRDTSLALALFGSVLGVLGYAFIALGDASTLVSFVPLSDLYHTPTVTPDVQATVVLLWEATQGITNTVFFVGIVFLMIVFVVLGAVMLKAPAFGRRYGGVSIVLGVAGTVGAIASLFVFQAIGVMFPADLIFLTLFGWKVFSLSRGPRSPKT